MKTLFLILLTTLFFGATPLEAASTRHPANNLTFNLVTTLAADETAPALNPPSSGCVTIEGSLTDEVRQKVADANGTIVEFKDADAAVFQAAVEDVLQQKAPFSASLIVVVHPTADSDNWNVGFFVDDCLVAFFPLDGDTIEQLSKSIEKGKI